MGFLFSATATLTCPSVDTIPKLPVAAEIMLDTIPNLQLQRASVFLSYSFRKFKPQRYKRLIFSISNVVSRAYFGSDSGNSPDTEMNGSDNNSTVSKLDCFDDSEAGDDEIQIEMDKTGRNKRSIRATISIQAGLESVWNILTDYERLAEFIPGLAVSKLLEKGDKFARLFQIGEQNLPFGLKFNAKGTIDCFERELEILSNGQRREIEFNMVEGDFQLFEGKWSVQQVMKSDSVLSLTTLSYIVDLKPKLWLPVQLVENRICNEIRRNLSCIRNEAEKSIDSNSLLQ